MTKFKVGDRVEVAMPDREGNPLFGTVVDPNFMGVVAIVRCDTLVSKQYCYTDDKEVMFLPENLSKVKE